ncbi:ubiquilin-1-like [Sceloporus undulatus]|uniref:ubiquilin-1-like n=1 Tax=Sceloporus undulatus TaxID=8520 RepID=UPI001C4C4320|nr:ubiquilin-1-like [Sceloporus undulatus]
METMDKNQEGATLTCPAVIASNPSFICVTAKSPKGSAQFVLPEISTVQQFKEELSKHFNCETSQLVLVFFGRILKDQDTLRQCGISDGMTVHLVIRSLKRDPEDPTRPSYVPRASDCTPNPPDNGSLPSPAFSSSTQGLWSHPETNPSSAASEWQLVPTSEKIIQKVRQVILANPEVQQLAQKVPAIGHILNNMGIMRVILNKMREIMDMAKNPEMVQDLKNPDQALPNLQNNIPGGDNPLRQLNSDVHEPSLNASPDAFVAPSPYATLVRNSCPEHSGLRGQEPPTEDARDRLGRLPFSHSTTSLCTNGSDDIFNSLASPLGHSLSVPNLMPASGTEMFNTGGIQAPEAAEIPMLIVNLCNAYTKRVMFSLMQNALLASEGTWPADPESIQQQMMHFSQQMQSPEMVAAMSNPKAIQAWVQMEQGLQALLAEAPVLIPWFMLRLKGLGYSTGGNPWPSDSPCQGPVILE